MISIIFCVCIEIIAGMPDESFAEVKYEGYWYWIDNSDIESKRVFTLMLFITTLTNQANDARAPVLTIPTQ